MSAYKKRRLHWVAVIGLAFLTAPLAAPADVSPLPDLGDASATVISPQQERKLGEDFMRKARRMLRMVDDPELNDYIQSLGERLLAHSSGAGETYQFFLVDDPSINAFAVPGGFIGVNTGLILAAQNEGELSAVLAHEITHVQQRHIPRLIAESKRTSGPAMAAMIAAILLAGTGHDGADAAIALTSATMAQSQLNYTRAFEQEADNLGIGILAAAGFDPRAMPAFFESLQTWGRLNETSLPEFLRTHPVTATRITESRQRAEQYTKKAGSDSSAFHLVRAKLRAAKGNPGEVAQNFKKTLEDGRYRNAHAERYGYALALARAQEPQAARRVLDELIRAEPDNVAYRLALADTEMAAGQRERGLKLYATAYQKHPASSPVAQRYAGALLEAGQPKRAQALLKDLLRRRAGDPILYKMLARAAGETGDLVAAHQALAEHYYLSGNADAALEQLRIATRFAKGNFYALSSIEARTQEMKEEVATWSGR